MAASIQSRKNPIIRWAHGKPIRKRNYANVSFSEYEYEKLLNISAETGISIAKLITIMAAPCEKCGHKNITMVIEKGALNTNRLNNGRRTIQNVETPEAGTGTSQATSN